MQFQPTTIHNPVDWNRLLASLPGGHLLQSWEWGELKQRYGWQAKRIAWLNDNQSPQAAVQILERKMRLPGLGTHASVLYCPKGPALDWSAIGIRQAVLDHLRDLSERPGVILLKIDPALPVAVDHPDGHSQVDHTPGLETVAQLRKAGWRESASQIQFRNTMTLDLSVPEETLLAAMKQKTRYNIRLASRKGVTTRLGGLQDLDLLYRMYAETSARDGFVIRKPEYYRDAWGAFIQAKMAQPLVAEVSGEPVAALIVYSFGTTTWYLYGMSRQLHREKMPNYLLQWEAIRWAKAQGCHFYDFWGAPDLPDPSDPMWGVYRFKQGFGARMERHVGAWDATSRPILYWLYSVSIPRIMSVLRARGKARTRQTIEEDDRYPSSLLI